jgi:hypothetical protein
MRPVIKKKRIDPRYFLHESLEEKKADKDYDGDGEVESPEAEYKGSKKKAINKAMKKKEHEKAEDDDKDRDPKKPGKQELLKGEKSLYEKIRGAIEEVFNEYLEEK